MNGFFDIKSANWLGGVNVHNTVTILLVAYVAWKVSK